MKRKFLALFLVLLCTIAGGSYVQTSSGGGGGSGITSINADSTAAQFLSTGTSGTDFAVADDAAGTHTFNLPSASATARGVVTTGAQTIAGVKTFSSSPVISALSASQVVATDSGKALASVAYTNANTASAIVQRDSSGNFSAGTITAALTGNASTATALASNPTDCSANTFATAIDAGGNLTCSAPSGVGMVMDLNGMLESPTDKTYVLVQKAAYAFTINTLDIVTASGTTTAAVKINGTSVTGISAVSVSSTPATGTATAANSVSAGDKVTLVLSSSSSPADLSFTLKYTR